MERRFAFARRRRVRSNKTSAFEPVQRIRFWPDKRGGRLRRGARAARPFILLAAIVALWPTLDPALVEPPAFLSTEPERVAEQFTRCGRGRGHACVVDGDTFRLGERRIRIIGIDAPEVHGRCADESRVAELAAARLQALLNQGPFVMTGRIDRMRDRYGRDLRVLRRTLPGGREQSIAAEMRSAGLAQRYAGGLRSGWC